MPKAIKPFGSYIWSEYLDRLTLSKQWLHEKREYLKECHLPKIIYEFDATTSLQGYPLAAMALAFGSLGVQMAAFFTYTPASVAAYNPGWRVHYLNYLHTPSRAMAFAAAGHLFRQTPRDSEPGSQGETWVGDNWKIDRTTDSVVIYTEDTLIHSRSINTTDHAKFVPRTILGIGNSPYAKISGNGSYRLERQDERRFILHLNPNQKYVNDPFRGRAFSGMANRYINVNESTAVSNLLDLKRDVEITIPGMKIQKVTRIDRQSPEEISLKDNTFHVSPGIYELIG